MTARQRRFWWAAGLLAALVGGVSLSYVIATNTDTGRRWLLGVVQEQASAIFGGRATLRIGGLRDIGLGGMSAVDVSLLDSAGVAVVHADSLDGTVSLGGILFDKAIHITSLSLRGVRLDLRQDFGGRQWNIAYIIAGDKRKSPPGPPGYGDNIRIDALSLRNLDISTVAPWSPHPIFKGSARDSVIAVRDSLHDITRTPQGLLERRRYVFERAVARDAIITQPSRKPSSIQLDTLKGTIADPPVRLLHASGEIRWTPDSLQLNLPSVRLPASTGSAVGSVSWATKGPIRYDVLVKAEAGLSDLTWIWDVLPTAGAGTSTVRMRTLDDAYDAEYALTDLDVRAMDSHLTGGITVVARPAELSLHSVDLVFAPMQSALMRRLSYDVVPATVQGTIEGRLVAKAGGPLTAFAIDQLTARFVDARIPGAVSSIAMNGIVSMGAQASARNLNVQRMLLDLRSARAIDSTLPMLDGTLSGRALVAAASLNGATVQNMALVWTDALGNRSALRGNARVGFGNGNRRLETSLQLDPISMKALARFDTTLAVLADVSGTVNTSGSLDALTWSAKVGAVGDGLLDLKGTASLIGSNWRVAADGSVNSLDARTWLGKNTTPSTDISGQVRMSAAGTRAETGSLALGEGTAVVSLSQPAADARAPFDVVASASLDSRRLQVDSAIAHVGGVTFDVHGALARDSSNADTLQVSARADTLERVRSELTRLAAMVEPADSATAATLRGYAADTLRGEASVSGFLLGSLQDFSATLALGARDAQVSNIRLNRIFGSFHAEHLLTKPTFLGAATADGVDGIGAIRIASAEFKVSEASPDSGRLVLDVSSRDAAHLVLGGGFTRRADVVEVGLDSLRFVYDSVTWRNTAPMRLVSDDAGVRIDSLELRSNFDGLLGLVASVPENGAVRAMMRLDRFPIGEAATFALGTAPVDGLLSGRAELTGTRDAPLLSWIVRADSLGIPGTHLSRVTTDGSYADRKLVARARIAPDSAVADERGDLRAEARVPLDLSLRTVEKRVLSDAVDAEIVADSLQLRTLGLIIDGVSNPTGIINGRLAIAGTMDRPVATGTMTMDQVAVVIGVLGIAPTEGRVVVRAAQDSLILESFRIRSGGPADTLSASGALRFAADEPVTMRAQLAANNVVLSRQRDGTDLNLSGRVDVVGPLKRPNLSGSLFVPVANLVIDPLGASTALDLTSDASLELLGVDEVPVAASAAQSLSRLGRFLSVSNARIDLGNEVWVQTPEAKVKISGGLDITMSGETLALEGEITANRGQYRLDLGVVNRSFAVDSGSVRFFGSDAIAPTIDISATNVVRLATGGEIPVRVHIGGTLAVPVISLSSSDPLFASAPESEIISLLIFGAPTFALDGQSQSTVKAVTGVLLPSLGGAFEGALQRLLPFKFNTLQLNTAGGQTRDDLTALSLLDNLSITAGKQLGTRAFLRLNTGVCRGSGQGASLWAGIAVEYRIAPGLLAQVGVDPGSAPCTRLGGDVLPRTQFGFDLFREWIF